MQQHMIALNRANEIRLGRAELKREVKRGERSVADIIDPRKAIPECAVSMTLTELLQAQYRWGRKRSLHLLAQISLGENRAIGTMTMRERRVVCEALGANRGEEIGGELAAA